MSSGKNSQQQQKEAEEEDVYGDFTTQGEEMISLAELRARFDPKLKYHSTKFEQGMGNLGQHILDPCAQSLTSTNSQLERSLREARTLEHGLSSLEQNWEHLAKETRECHANTGALLKSPAVKGASSSKQNKSPGSAAAQGAAQPAPSEESTKD